MPDSLDAELDGIAEEAEVRPRRNPKMCAITFALAQIADPELAVKAAATIDLQGADPAKLATWLRKASGFDDLDITSMRRHRNRLDASKSSACRCAK